ncbi:MAG: DUF1353 domain-containing protein [Victivallaceae bacterium]|nr:DUF1353 domain-containing protein [Victivallaceae bacterium]
MKIELNHASKNIEFWTREPLTFHAWDKWRTVPTGFYSDGMSVPRIFWRLISPQIGSDAVTRCAVIHDWLYQSHVCTRKEADQWLRDHLIADAGWSKWKANLVYAGVRIGGASHWGDEK